jgi:hypothetical protein
MNPLRWVLYICIMLKYLGNLLFISILFVGNFLFAQCSLYEIPLKERIEKSVLIVEGKVIHQESFKSNGLIYTSNTIEICKIFRGDMSSPFIEIITTGGVVGDEMLTATNMLSLKKENTGIFICKLSRISLPGREAFSYEAIAGKQGFIQYDLLLKSASDVFNEYKSIEKDLYKRLSSSYKKIKDPEIKEQDIHEKAVPFITGFSPSAITSGTGQVLTITGSGFGASRGSGVVSFRNADAGGSTFIDASPVHYVKWTDNEIVVEVPSEAGTGTFRVRQGVTTTSSQALTVQFSLLNVTSEDIPYSIRMVSRNNSGGYIWQKNNLFAANEAAGAAFIRAFNRWKCNTGVNWFMGEETTVAKVEKDNISVITFDEFNELPDGVLGVCYNHYSTCRSMDVQETIGDILGNSSRRSNWHLVEMDIIFNKNISWQYGPTLPNSLQYDFESIVFHELGHGHQLGHVISTEDPMHYAYSRGANRRDPTTWNLEAGMLVIEQSGKYTTCGFDPHQPIEKEICEVNDISEFQYEGLHIYPNPTMGMLNLNYSLHERVDVIIDIYDFTGKKQVELINEKQKIGHYKLLIDLEKYGQTNGLYFVRIILDGTPKAYKVLKN